MEGWIKLYRQLLETELWRDEKFTRGQAWVDLLLLASHKETSFRKRGIKIVLSRGQIGKSLDELSKRWMWSIGKVKRFLVELEEERQIKVDNNNVNQIITVLNYDKFQGNSNADDNADDNANDNANDNADRNANGTQTETQTETYKNKKNDNNIPLPRVRKRDKFDECFDALLNCPLWIENVLRVSRITPEQFTEYLKQFFDELRCRGETYKSEDDAKFHFHSWLKIEFEKQRKKQNGTIRNKTGTQQGNDNGNVTVREVKL